MDGDSGDRQYKKVSGSHKPFHIPELSVYNNSISTWSKPRMDIDY